MITQLSGVHMTLLMPANSTKERVLKMEAFGAKVILTDASKGIEYSRELANKMVEKESYYTLKQFANPDNYGMHYRTTGPEVFRDTNVYSHPLFIVDGYNGHHHGRK